MHCIHCIPHIATVRASLALIAGIIPVVATAGAPPSTSSGGTPFGALPFAVPAQFEAEDFDRGGQDVAYHDNAAGNTGGAYRAEEDVDIRATADVESQYVVFNFETGEWLTYTLDVATDARYSIDLRVSTTLDDAAFHIEIDGIDVSGRVTVPNTGSWQRYRWVGAPRVTLETGRHVLRVVSAQQYFNFDAVRVTFDTSEVSSSTSTTKSRERETTAANVRSTAP